MAKITIDKFKKACKGSGGFQAVVARALGVTRSAICHYLKKHPDLKELLSQEAEYILDMAEHNINKEILAGNIKVCWWALLNRKEGRARGYNPKKELEQIGSSTRFNLIEKSNEEN